MERGLDSLTTTFVLAPKVKGVVTIDRKDTGCLTSVAHGGVIDRKDFEDGKAS